MNSMTYRGPALKTLHEDYAKKGRIDDDAPIRGRRRIAIEAPVALVWTTLIDLPRWNEILEPDVKDVVAPDGIAADAVFSRTLRRAKITAKFAVVDENRELAWTGSSFGAHVVHRFQLEPASEGTTTSVLVEESMAGRLLGTFFSVEKLCASLETGLRGLKKVSEARAVEATGVPSSEG